MYPQRAVLSDARRRGVPILPLDVQKSAAGYRVEAGTGGALGLRMALKDVHGITAEQAERIAAGQPYTDVPDFWSRARPALPVAQRLARVGALDSIAPGAHRREILLQVDDLHRQHSAAAIPDQLVLATDTQPPLGTGLPAMTEGEQLEAELQVIGMDVSRHLMASYHPLLAELGVTPADALADVPAGETVLVAGAKVAIQTPPLRSGHRTIFVTLDDGTRGKTVDLAFFDDSHEATAHTVFHSFLLLVRGVVQRRGKSLSVVGARAWDLAAVDAAHREGGTAAVRRLMAPVATPDSDEQPGARSRPGGGAGRMWHASSGSAG